MQEDPIDCKKCYHLIRKDNGSSFCFAEGFISESEPPLVHCPYYINKDKSLKICPNCQEIHNRNTDFCKNCKIIKNLNLYEEKLAHDKKIGLYSINDL